MVAVMGQGQRAAVYCRVSTTAQEEDGTSLGTQEAACRRYAQEHGYQVLDDLVYRETYSGGELTHRPKLTVLRQAIRARQIDAVIFYAIDRLTRDQAHLGVLVSETDEHAVRLVCVTEQFEDSPIGRFIRNALAFKAEMERADIRERAMRGQRARVDAGKPMPGKRPPYGYVWVDADKTRLVPDPLTARVVRRIFERITAGQSARNLAAQFTTEGIPTPMGRERWSVPTITGIVRHPVYMGDVYAYAYKSEKSKNGKTVMRQRPADERVLLPDIAPALVSQELAAEASQRLTRNRSTSVRNNRDPESALLRGGYARCGYCGKVAIAINTGDKGALYRCNSVNRDRYGCPGYGVPTSTVDVDVWSQVKTRLLNPDIIGAEVQRLIDRDGPATDDLAAIDRRLEEIARSQRNLAKRIATIDDDEASALLGAELISLGRQAAHLRAERDAITLLRYERESLRDRLADMASWCRTVAANLERLTYEQRRLALDAFSIQVRLWAKGDRDPQWEITAFPEVLFGSSCSSSKSPT